MQELGSLVKGEVLTDEAARLSVSGDFGRIMTKVPQAVVRPSSAEDVAAVLRFASARGIPVSTRGEAHSQTGQSLSSGIVIDLGSLETIHSVDRKALTVTLDSGVRWRTLVEYLYPMGLIPRVLTNNLNVTIGGTLSVAGLGVASFRFGAQGDNVLELQAVTGTGEIVECSAEKNREVFDAVRSGLGQFGVITRAKLLLREFLPKVRMYFLLYDELGAFMEDAAALMDEGRFSYLESWCVPCPQGFKLEGERKRAFAQWFYPLHATIEFREKAPEDAAMLAGLHHYRQTHVEDRSLMDFAARLDPLFEIWRRSGAWDMAHPWMEAIMPWETARAFIDAVLSEMEPQQIAGGHILLWPSKGTTSSVPLFMRPSGQHVMGFGILPAVPQRFLDIALPRLDAASDLAMVFGGKRYLSGIIRFDKDRWRQHWGEKWDEVNRLKKKFDPTYTLNPGFIDYDR